MLALHKEIYSSQTYLITTKVFYKFRPFCMPTQVCCISSNPSHVLQNARLLNVVYNWYCKLKNRLLHGAVQLKEVRVIFSVSCRVLLIKSIFAQTTCAPILKLLALLLLRCCLLLVLFTANERTKTFQSQNILFMVGSSSGIYKKIVTIGFFEMPNLIALINNQSPNVRTYRHYLRLLVDGYCAYNLLTLAETSEYREHGIGTYTIAIKLK